MATMGPRSPSSSVCSFAGSVNSEILQPRDKYLMKTLCLSKKSAALPGKAEYANLLTCGLGARKWLASLDFDAENFKAAILNIYPRLASVPSYTLWNVKPDKTFEKLPCTVNTPKRIRAYLGPSFTGSLVIIPSEEISLGPVKVPMHRILNSSTSTKSLSRSSRDLSREILSKDEKAKSESGYESYQESIRSRDQNYFHGSSSSSHKHQHSLQPSSSGRTRHICLTCGRMAKQAGSSGFYDIHNSTTFATSDGYISIAKKLRALFHLELPRSKIIASDQICRKCFRALNEIHFLETQLNRSKEEMMSTLFSTVAKVSKLEQMARDAKGDSSDSSTSSLGTLMTTPGALNPWFHENAYVINQQKRSSSSGPKNLSNKSQEADRREPSPTKQATTVAAIFPTHQSGERGRYVEYNSPQPVFLAPLAGFAAASTQDPRAQSPGNSSGARGNPMVPINMSISSSTASAIFLGKSAPASQYFTTAKMPEPERSIEERMAAEAEADAKEASERNHEAYMEEAYNCRRQIAANDERNTSIRRNFGNNSSPGSHSPSPPTTSSNVGSDNRSNGSTSGSRSPIVTSSPKPNSMNPMRRPWKKRYHEITNNQNDSDHESSDKKRARLLKCEKRAKVEDNIKDRPEMTSHEVDLTSDSSASLSPGGSEDKAGSGGEQNKEI